MDANEQKNAGQILAQNQMQGQLNQAEIAGEDQFDTSFLNIGFFIRTVVLYWQWFVFSVIICLSVAAVYLRYTPAVYNVNARLLIKDEDDGPRSRMNSIQAAENLGMMTMTNGFDNEIEILTSKNLAYDVVKKLKLYVNYWGEGRVVDRVMYGNVPINIDVDAAHLSKLETNINVKVVREDATNFSV
jgi:uncharacterized protein involved in exopolysaccharide biosynthesis